MCVCVCAVLLHILPSAFNVIVAMTESIWMLLLLLAVTTTTAENDDDYGSLY